ncbi:MAG: Flp family type IVb pilin [Hyphomicrobiales bacterium]|nr:Flp family type IVb pilin [Hyphomicrobiales bacterium]MDE2114613.1 Flp family type IVb pilin [Hyphomicrobiales bacterium]
MISKFLTDEKGGSSLEYAVIAALISVIIIPFLPGIGSKTQNMFLAFSNRF